MRVLILLFILGIVFVFQPALAKRRGWAVVLWRRIKIVAVAYVAILTISAVLRLALGWEEIY